MVKTKKTQKKYSSSIHVPRTRYSYSFISSPFGKVILGVIFSIALIVIISVVTSYYSQPEKLVQSELESLSSEYYENYFYKDVTDSNALAKYEKSGLANITLRQLLLTEHQSATSNLEKYCDINSTYVKFYPESPYKNTSYHTKFNYSCNY